jgi:hypothetical protein
MLLGWGRQEVQMGKPHGKLWLERLRRTWQDNIKVDHRDMYIMRVEDGWNWLRIMSIGRLWYYWC